MNEKILGGIPATRARPIVKVVNSWVRLLVLFSGYAVQRITSTSTGRTKPRGRIVSRAMCTNNGERQCLLDGPKDGRSMMSSPFGTRDRPARERPPIRNLEVEGAMLRAIRTPHADP